MDHAYNSSTVEMNDTGFDSLQDQILTSKTHKNEQTKDIRDKEERPVAASDRKSVV